MNRILRCPSVPIVLEGVCLSVDTGLILVFSRASATRLIQVACFVTLCSSTNFPYKSVKYKNITTFMAVCPAYEELIAYVTLGKGLQVEPTNGAGLGKRLFSNAKAPN